MSRPDSSYSLLRQYALGYAQRGWPLFPCWWLRDGPSWPVMGSYAFVSDDRAVATIEHRVPCACPKHAACRAAGKHPRCRFGSKEATTDLDVIKSWWNLWPNAHIAVGTGRAGLVVIDVDPRNGGDQSLHQLEADLGGSLPETLTAKTGGGGEHRFYLADDHQVPTMQSWRDGIDVKAAGNSHVILPPSPHTSGGRYEWLNQLPIAPLSSGLAERLHRSSTSRSTRARRGGSFPHISSSELPSTEQFLARGFRPGSRDNDCVRLARRLLNEYGDPGAVRNIVYDIWKITDQSGHPFTWQDAERCITSAVGYWRADHETNLRLARALFTRGVVT
jgi:bifunctional DNA primase/polymerase-like protein